MRKLKIVPVTGAGYITGQVIRVNEDLCYIQTHI